MNAKKTRFYAEGAIDFAEMWFTTCSYLCQHDRIEKNWKNWNLYFCIFLWFLLLVQTAPPVVSTEIQKSKISCSSFVAHFTGNLLGTKEFLNSKTCKRIPHKTKSTSCSIFLTSIIIWFFLQDKSFHLRHSTGNNNHTWGTFVSYFVISDNAGYFMQYI